MAITEWVQLEPEWSRLSAFYAQARAAAASANIAAEAWSGINQRYTQVSKTIARLARTGDLGAAVVSGDLSPAKWASIANQAAETLRSILADFRGEDLYDRAWKEIIVATATEIRDTAAAAAKAAPFALGGVVVVLVLLVALKVLK